jgi:tagaturonate reductase
MTTPTLTLSKAILSPKRAGGQPVALPEPATFDLPEKVLQFGTGVLLRGLQDYFIDRANRRGVFNGRVVVVKSTDAGGVDTFGEQDNLFTHCIRGIEGGRPVEEFIVNAAISRILSARGDWPAVLACAHNPALQIIISNTTEIGIQLVEDNVFGAPPVSFPGKLTAFLYERFKAFGGAPDSGMVVVPCELVTDNGRLLREIVLEQARQNQLNPAFSEWLTAHNTFCNSLVDRIVPGKPDEAETRKLFARLGYRDDLLTVSEVYRLWAVEGDDRVRAILSFAEADEGVVVSPDITPYRERKLRLLNGTHTISVGLGYLCGLETVGDCMSHPHMSRFMAHVALREIVPAVPVDEVSTTAFAEAVLDRFRNPYLVHPLINITLQYTSKMKMRNVPTLLNHYRKHRAAPTHFALGFAAYLLFMRAVQAEDGKYFGRRDGELYPITDQFAPYFHEKWGAFQEAEAESFVNGILADAGLWGADLSQLPDFAPAVSKHLLNLLRHGAVETLRGLEVGESER